MTIFRGFLIRTFYGSRDLRNGFWNCKVVSQICCLFTNFINIGFLYRNVFFIMYQFKKKKKMWKKSGICSFGLIAGIKTNSNSKWFRPQTLLNRYLSNQNLTCFCTLRSLLSVLFYQTTWSEFFQKVSIKRPGPSQKKNRSYCFISGPPRPIFGLY